MALDATARETNFRDSVKEYFYTYFKNTLGYPLFFRQGFTTVNIRESLSVEKWIVVTFGDFFPAVMSEAIVEIRPCTRNDPSFFKLAQMSDNICGYLTPSSGDGMTRIPFYQSASARASWVLIGGILVHDYHISSDLVADDGTNYKIITARMRFASKL